MDTVPTLVINRSLRRSVRTFSADRLRYLDEAASSGSLSAIKFGPSRMLILSDPDAAREMLIRDSSSWTRPPAFRFPVRLGLGENLFTQSDRAWKGVQPIVAPAFGRRAILKRLEHLDELIEGELSVIPRDTEIDLELAMGRIALVVAAWVFLEEHVPGEQAEQLAEHQRRLISWVGDRTGRISGGFPFPGGHGYREMLEHRRAMEAYADGAVERAFARGVSEHSVLGLLSSARSRGRSMSREQIRSHVLGLLVGGNETTACALSLALVHGAQNPGEWARIRHDPSATSGYVTETLRLTPPAWGLPRTPTGKGAILRVAGTEHRVWPTQVITIYIRGINRDPARWPDPGRFMLDRHIASSREQDRSLVPFGLGPRGCIGQHLAIAEMTAILPALARHGDVELNGDFREDASFALRVRGGLRGRFLSRSPLESTVS